MNKLKPCPFCGGENIRIPNRGDDYVWCKNIHCPIYDVWIYVNRWNTRADLSNSESWDKISEVWEIGK